MKFFKKVVSVAVSAILLLSILPITASASQNKKSVILGGNSFGVKLFTNGVIIIKTESCYDGKMYRCPAKESGLEINDVIVSANKTKVSNNEQLQSITQNSSGKTIDLTIMRGNKKLSKKITPVKNTAGMYLIGAWVRDSCAGIGTVTYYDTDNKYFAALGHGICDTDTMALMPLGKGEAVKASVSGISKSSCGKVGSLNGYFTEEIIGSLTKNSQLGIYGTINDTNSLNGKKIEIADNSEIKTGNAKLYTTIKDDKIGCYDIEISKLCNALAESNENFVIKVTSKELIDECGGIVQGMSGSPIVQNGKLVGAVTHVFVNSPKEGYGVLAQNMVLNYTI